MKPHVHRNIIKAWADGAEIQVYNHHSKTWDMILKPTWNVELEYRVKPVVKKKYASVYTKGVGKVYTSAQDCAVNINPYCKYLGMIELVFDDTTGELKEAHVV